MKNMERKNIYSFRKSKKGLTTALLATLVFVVAGAYQEVYAADTEVNNTAATNASSISNQQSPASDSRLNFEDMVLDSAVSEKLDSNFLTKPSVPLEKFSDNYPTSDSDFPNELSDEDSANSSLNSEASNSSTLKNSLQSVDNLLKENSGNSSDHATTKQNFITVNPIKAGDFKISGKTLPKSYVFINVDDEAKSSIENPLIADENGNFSLTLEDNPIYFGQKITLSSYSQEALENEDEEDESGIAEESVDIALHKDAYKRPTEKLEKINGIHQVLTDPIYVGQNKIKGHTSVVGSVMMSVNGIFMTLESKIVADGSFETKLQPALEVLKFKKGDLVYLSFISEDGDVVLKQIHIRDFETDGNEKTIELTADKITFQNPKLSGHTEPDAQVQLYDATSGEFIADAISDENGAYSTPLFNIKQGQKFYRIFIGADNMFKHITVETVDKTPKTLDKNLIPFILDKLEIFGDKEEAEISNTNPVFVRKLTTQTSHFIGRSIFPNSYVKITSSISQKKFPPLVSDNLGYFGVDINDIQRKFEKDEKITFHIIDPKTMTTLAKKTITIINEEEIVPPEERSLTLGTVTTDHGYLQGTTAPNLEIIVYKNGKSEEILAKTMSDANGEFGADLGAHELHVGDILSVAGYDTKNNQQIFWSYYPVIKGNGVRITKETADKLPSNQENMKDKNNAPTITGTNSSNKIEKTKTQKTKHRTTTLTQQTKITILQTKHQTKTTIFQTRLPVKKIPTQKTTKMTTQKTTKEATNKRLTKFQKLKKKAILVLLIALSLLFMLTRFIKTLATHH